MENNSAVNESLETLFSHLERFFKSETVVGEPIIIGETTLIPIISVSFGCGGGGGGGKDEKGNDGGGTGVGVGARITPDAVLVIKGDDVKMMSVKNKNNLEQLVGMVPGIIKKFKIKKDADGCCSEVKSEE